MNARRRGSESSETRTLLLSAAAELMREEGYAAVTARKLSARAGVNVTLVHYYFKSMDDLFIALYRGFSEKFAERISSALSSDAPIKAAWELMSDRSIVSLTTEFVALANHRKAIQEVISGSAEYTRHALTELAKRVMAHLPEMPIKLPPEALAIILQSVGHRLVLEEQTLGINSGHEQTSKAFSEIAANFDQLLAENR